jgi:hypothetical protein
LPTSSVLIDDRLLVAHLLGADVVRRSRAAIYTTTYWYYRACRAAVLGGAGQLSGPFRELGRADQALAIETMLRLPETVGLPDPRQLVPAMVDVARSQSRLNVLNVEAVAAARTLSARVLLSPAAAAGVLGPALDAERIRWSVSEPS